MHAPLRSFAQLQLAVEQQPGDGPDAAAPWPGGAAGLLLSVGEGVLEALSALLGPGGSARLAPPLCQVRPPAPPPRAGQPAGIPTDHCRT